MKLLHVVCFVDQSNVAQLDASVETRGDVRIMRFFVSDPHVLLDIADKLHNVGTSMLRHSPRPEPKP